MDEQYLPHDGRIAWFLPNFDGDYQAFGYHKNVTFHVFPKFGLKSVFQIDIFNPGFIWGKPILTELRECESILECMRGCQDFADRYKEEATNGN